MTGDLDDIAGIVQSAEKRFEWAEIGNVMADRTVSLRGLKCPLPALKTRKLLAAVPPGDTLTVECTDPLSAIDIPNLIRETGDVLEASARSEGLLTFRIRKM